MILYVDETENEKYFIVAALLCHSKTEIDDSFKHFKNSIRKTRIKQKHKEQIFVEFKSNLLDRSFQNIKIKMLKEIVGLDISITYSCYTKIDKNFKQSVKEMVYIQLLEKIVNNIENDFDLIFDKFNLPGFESRIKRKISKNKNVINAFPIDSKFEAGLMYVDNICSVIRLYLSNADRLNFYEYIKNKTIEIK